MKKFYHTSLFYKYRYIPVEDKKNCFCYTELSFYEKLFSLGEKVKFKKYSDREEYLDKKGNLFIRFYAYIDIPDYVIVQPYFYPSEEIHAEYPECISNIEEDDYWHNLKDQTFKFYYDKSSF